MRKVGILHISDTHICASSIQEIDLLAEKITKDIKRVCSENSMEINLICFTGDLIHSGKMAQRGEEQLQLAEEHFIYPLLKAFGLTEKDFILVPGNHEVDTDKIAKLTEKGLSTISSKEEINETIAEMERGYNERLEYFYNYMHEKYITNARRGKLGYSIVRDINGINIGIVGIDSAWRSTGAGDKERGQMIVGEQQVDFLYNGISSAELKICLMHHPLDWISNIEMMSVERRLNNFDFVLRGHVHDLEDKQICTQQFKTIYNTSGKLFPVDGYYSGYSILDINMDFKTCSIFSREFFSSPREDFDKSLRINSDGKAEYKLSEYDETKLVEYELKNRLKTYYENFAEKYAMLKSINTYSPDKATTFFVEPLLFEKSEKERAETVKKTDEQDVKEPISLEQLLSNSDNILLLGKKETGKTTILQQFGRRYASDEKRIPIYVDMIKLPKSQNRIFTACQNFMFDNMPEDLSITKDQFTSLLHDGKVLCLLDNVDISNANHSRWIRKFIMEFSNNRFVLAAEERFYQTYTLKDFPDFGIDFKCIYLEYFGQKQVREMVTKWGEGKDNFDANELTQRIVTCCNNIDFAITPFNVAVFMTIWDVDRSFVPINEGKVMRTYLEIVLEKLSPEEFHRSSYSYDNKQHFLGYLAYTMCKKDEYFFTLGEFYGLVDEYHNKMGFQKNKSKFDIIFFENNILCKNSEHVFFGNTSILEYCLATYALIEPELYNLMLSKGKRNRFAHEIAFYSGIVPDCTELLNCLNEEIVGIIVENMDILDDIENINIGIEINLNKENFKEVIENNRRSIEEVDDLVNVPTAQEEKSPLELSKRNILDESESLLDILLIYGNVIKNAENIDKSQKKIHLENYILGMNFLFGIIIKEFSAYLKCKTKEEFVEESGEKCKNITDEEFTKMREDIVGLVKLILPIGMQLSIVNNIGTPKLEISLRELIEIYRSKKFTRFMLSFLLCDIGYDSMKAFLMSYIKEEDSQDILLLILTKLKVYYDMWYFGRSPSKDDMILDLITEVEIKLSGKAGLSTQISKGKIKKRIKQHSNIQRAKMIN